MAVAGVLTALALGGCSASGSDASANAPGTTAPTSTPSTPSTSPSAPLAPSTDATPLDPNALRYVALGDSYAAAPGVPQSDLAGGCFRSDHNYAHLVAEADPTIALTDVTCSGATSDDVIAKQVPELTPDTDLVTLGVGGNDFGLFTRVLGGCLALASSQNAGPAPCTDTASSEVSKVSADIQTNIGKVLDAIAQAAPDARIIVVGYPALLPADGTTCPDLVPLADGDYPFVASINRGLSNALRGQAEERDLSFLDVFAASKGHDVCSDDPWVNGINVAADGTIPFHPFGVEQAAVATMITDLL